MWPQRSKIAVVVARALIGGAVGLSYMPFAGAQTPPPATQGVAGNAAQGNPPGADSGLPLPRFVSLRAGEVNMRSGPGVQYPVDWVYQRRHLPMEVIAEFQTWRKVRDHQGTQGWVHQTMIGGERTAIVLGRMRTARAKPESGSRALAKLEPDVITQVLQCPKESGWCRIRASGVEGWLRRVEIWGIQKDEIIE